MTCTFELTKNKYDAFARTMYLRQRKRLIGFGLVTAVFFFIWGAGYLQTGIWAFIALEALGLACAASALFGYKLEAAGSYNRLVDAHGGETPRMTVSFAEEAIHNDTQRFPGVVSYDSIRALVETSSFYYLLLETDKPVPRCVIVEKASLTGESTETLTDCLKTRCKKLKSDREASKK